MEDYKNQEWWIELQKSLEDFDDSKMSESDLKKWNGAVLGGKVAAVKVVKDKLGIHGATKEQRSKWAKKNASISGTKTFKNKTGVHNPEVRQRYREEWIDNKKGMFDLDFQKEKGLRHAKEGVGFHSLSKEQHRINSKKGAAASALVKSKPVLQFTIDGKFVAEYPSATQASRAMGKKSITQIVNNCNGKAKITYGYVWKYKD